ncbi:MAG TPA: hypothetical protein VIM76_04765, partial [Candidatus Dormibacteraeota bacterium]
MIATKRLMPWIVCVVLAAALPVFGAPTASAAAVPAPASHSSAPASHTAASPRTQPFMPMNGRERAAARTRSFKRGGSVPVSLRGTTGGGNVAILGQTAASRSAGSHSGARGPSITPTAPDNLAGFAGIGQASAIHNFGIDQEFIPADPDIAVGPTDIVEVVNSSMYVFSRSGAVLGAADLNSFMFVTPGYSSTDPRVIYDPSAGRFWITITEVPNSFS